MNAISKILVEGLVGFVVASESASNRLLEGAFSMIYSRGTRKRTYKRNLILGLELGEAKGE